MVDEMVRGGMSGKGAFSMVIVQSIMLASGMKRERRRYLS